MPRTSHSSSSSTVRPVSEPASVFGHSWADIDARQRGEFQPTTVDLHAKGDFGSDPVGDGTFRMVPSGDIVAAVERDRRLAVSGRGA